MVKFSNHQMNLICIRPKVNGERRREGEKDLSESRGI